MKLSNLFKIWPGKKRNENKNKKYTNDAFLSINLFVNKLTKCLMYMINDYK